MDWMNGITGFYLHEQAFIDEQVESEWFFSLLFVFVLHPEVEATNNRSERQARSEAMARKAARTSKTESGAKRRGVIMSVLASLSKRMEHFTLGSVLAEINGWFETGRSVFRRELVSLQAATTAPSKPPP